MISQLNGSQTNSAFLFCHLGLTPIVEVPSCSQTTEEALTIICICDLEEHEEKKWEKQDSTLLNFSTQRSL